MRNRICVRETKIGTLFYAYKNEAALHSVAYDIIYKDEFGNESLVLEFCVLGSNPNPDYEVFKCIDAFIKMYNKGFSGAQELIFDESEIKQSRPSSSLDDFDF